MPDEEADSGFVHFAAKIEFIPKQASLPAKILARFEQSFESFGFNMINPTIMLYTIIPDDSEVFRVIKDGDLRGLVTLLEERKASVRDCNASGRSLLSVSDIQCPLFAGINTR
jgi:hypothetical protein